mmetsp:Transcript_14484/g.21799  ORF Transcript_14484/g.21799 Transcript_14484/m.21799 type:complete len:443 (-) Transcript_14484:31-1359(-)
MKHALLSVCLLLVHSLSVSVSSGGFSSVPANGSFSCLELQKWAKTEKHYSNDRKTSLFALMTPEECLKQPVIRVQSVKYSQYNSNEKYFSSAKDKCAEHDENAVVFLSNFSINHNFSHFLHALLRLFCALVDARYITYDEKTDSFVKSNYIIWIDENFKLSSRGFEWLSMMGPVRKLGSLKRGTCVSANSVVYGSGCVHLLPPEKWYGYPGCRANKVLPSFAAFVRAHHKISNIAPVVRVDNRGVVDTNKLSLAFSVRKVGDLTGKRSISNLAQLQTVLDKSMRVSHQLNNISFEDLDVPSVVHQMSRVHVFVSVHGAGITNTFFMLPGTAVVEILPFPLCNCRSPDYFYGMAGYYQGSSMALGLKHYTYCVPAFHTKWHEKPKDASPNVKCNWRHLHAVEEVRIDETNFASLIRSIERELIADGAVEITTPIISLNPHVNG